MVDYSKWDTLDISDSEDDESERQPKVTRLDSASKVTWGGPKRDGTISIEQSSAPVETLKKQIDSKPGVNAASASSQEPPVRSVEAASQKKEQNALKGEKDTGESGKKDGTAQSNINDISTAYTKWDKILAEYDSDSNEDRHRNDDEESVTDSDSENEADSNAKSALPPPPPRLDATLRLDDPTLRRNGGLVDKKYIWSQSKHEVMVRFFVPLSTRGKDVRITATKWHLHIQVGSTVLVEGKLCYPIMAREDKHDEREDIDDELDWELRDIETKQDDNGAIRLLCVTFLKCAPAADVVVWWKGVFSGDPSVEIEEMEDRDSAATTLFQQNWTKAHADFKEKLKDHRPTIIDV